MKRIGFARSCAVMMMTASILCACTTGMKETLMRPALDGEDARKEYFEATLRVLDDNPEYVDEFFQLARSHEPTLERFIQNAAQNLHRRELAKMTAKHLARNPRSLRQILVETMRAAKDDPEARAAIAAALGDETDIATSILTDDPEVLLDSFVGTLKHALKKPKARLAFIRAMYATSPALADLLADNPELMKHMIEKLAAEADPAEIKRLLGSMVEDIGPND